MYTQQEADDLVNEAVEKGFELFTNKRYEDAEITLTWALKVDPENVRALQIMGLLKHNQRKFTEGINFFQTAIKIEPNNAENHSNLSLCYSNLGEYEKSMPHIQKAVKLAPNCNFMHSNMGLIYFQNKDFDKAIECFLAAIKLKNEATTWCMLGGCYAEKRLLDKAEECFKKSIEIKPKFAGAHLDLAVIYHLKGDWDKAWKEYEWRFECHDQTKFWLDLFDIKKRWCGEDLKGKRIILHSEQGVGDCLHFFRYVSLVKKLGAYVIMHCQEALDSLFSPHVDEMYTIDPGTIPLHAFRDANFGIPEYDYFASVMSLPYLLGNPPIPGTPYLHTDKKISLDNYSDYFKIGISWGGNPQHPNDAYRSCRLNLFRPIHDMPNVKLFSLQKDKRLRQYHLSKTPIDLMEGSEGMKIIDMEMNTFEDTAAILKSLDLLITVDTSVLHLAGALQVPTWALLSYNNDWRWKAEGSNTEWYSSVKLFRQKTLGDWIPVFDEIKEALQKEKYDRRS